MPGIIPHHQKPLRPNMKKRQITVLLPTMIILLAALLAGALAGCTPPTPTPTATPSPTSSPTPTLTPTVTPTSTNVPDPPTLPLDLPDVTPEVFMKLSDQNSYGYTHINPDGNRVLTGSLTINTQPPVIFTVEGKPRWVVGAPTDTGSVWAVVLADGTTQGFVEITGVWNKVSLTPAQLPAGMPPLLRVERGNPYLVTAPLPNASPFTHPIVLGQSNRMVFVDESGDVVLWNGEETGRLALNALPDARILQDAQENVLLLTGATTVYAHGVLGDKIEASTVHLLRTSPTLEISTTITIDSGKVIEGIAPIWADIDGNGSREILITVADGLEGAQLVAYRQDGTLFAASEPIGRGYRWRNQMAVAPLLGTDENIVVDVLTPHIGGLVEYFRLRGDSLDLLTSIQEYSSHQIGSRNLDLAIIGRFDPRLNKLIAMVPTQNYRELHGLNLNLSGTTVLWRLELPSALSTNLSGFTFPDGTAAVGFGLENGEIRFYLP